MYHIKIVIKQKPSSGPAFAGFIFLIKVKGIHHDEHDRHADDETEHRFPGETGDKIGHEADRRRCQGIGDLGRYVDDMITAGTGGGHDRGIGYR